MNGEWMDVLVIVLRLIVLIVFVMCYVVGGRRWKWIRRWVGGVWLGGMMCFMGVWFGGFRWWWVFGVICYPAVLSLGYGGEGIFEKVLRRGVYGIALGAVSFLYGNWILGLFQLVLSFSGSVFLGTRNPIKAVEEEALIAMCGVFCVPFMF